MLVKIQSFLLGVGNCHCFLTVFYTVKVQWLGWTCIRRENNSNLLISHNSTREEGRFLDGQYYVSFWDKGWSDLLAVHYKRLVLPKLRFLQLWHKPVCAVLLPPNHSIISQGTEGKRSQCEQEAHATCYAMSSKVLCLWHQNLVSSTNIYKTMVVSLQPGENSLISDEGIVSKICIEFLQISKEIKIKKGPVYILYICIYAFCIYIFFSIYLYIYCIYLYVSIYIYLYVYFP